MRGIIFLILFAAPIQGQFPVSAPGFVLTGTIRDNTGAAIAGGTLTLERLPPYPKGRMWERGVSTSSDSNGEFRFDHGLNHGSYRLCADAAGATWLNPCKWGLPAPTVSFSAGKSTISFSLVVNKGAAVPILIQDPGQLLLKNLGVTPGAHLLLGVGDDAFLFESALLKSQGSTSFNYQIVIPYNRTVNLVVASSFFQLSNALGVALPSQGSTAIPITVTSGQQPPSVTLNVTGSAKVTGSLH